MDPSRGILNASGVSCHLTSALQLLWHTVPPLREALQLLAPASANNDGDDGPPSNNNNNNSQEDAWLVELACLCRDCNRATTITNSKNDPNHQQPVDPTRFYEALPASSSSSLSSLDPHELGDAAAALRLLLQAIRQHIAASANNNGERNGVYNSAVCSILEKLLDRTLFRGRWQSTLVGTNNTCSADGTQKTKVIKERGMSLPFVVSGACASIQESLRLATTEPQLVQGYVWSSVKDDDQQQQQQPESAEGNDEAWTTHRTSQITSLPRHLLLHVQRFVHEHDGGMVQRRNSFDIPMALDLQPYYYHHCRNSDENMSECCLEYELKGAILHASDTETNREEEQEEDGHYVALIRRNNHDEWIMMDDDKIMQYSSGDVEPLWGGTWEVSTKHVSYCATVLAYVRSCDCHAKETDALLEDLRQCLIESQYQRLDNNKTETVKTKSADIDWSRPHELVGRRLHVRWAKGKFYAGKVASYNMSTGKHVIQYDDGDVREYRLRQKTIQWDESM